MSRIQKALSVQLILTGTVLSGCVAPGSSPATEIRVASDDFGAPQLQEALVDEPLYDQATRTVHLEAALNEVVGFELNVTGRGKLDLVPGDFAGPEGKSLANNVEIFRRHTVEIGRLPAWHIKRIPPGRRAERVADVLVPSTAPEGGLPARIGRTEVLSLWVDVRVPKGTAPGEYAAEFQITSDTQPPERINVSLVVWPFVLPDTVRLEAITDLDQRALFDQHVTLGGDPYGPARILSDDPARDKLEGTLEAALRLLSAHRLSPKLSYLYPLTKIQADEHMSVDWSDYDRVASRSIQGTVYPDRQPARSWPIPFNEEFPEPPAYGAMNSPTYAALLHDYFRDAAAHFEEEDWLSRAYVSIPYADAMSDRARKAVEHFGYIVHHCDPRLRTMSQLFPQDMSVYGWHGFRHTELRDHVDIWAPRGQFFDPRAIASDLGSEAWLTVDRPPFSGSTALCAPAVDSRVLPWQGWIGAVDAVYLGAANDWPQREIGGDPQDCVDHDPSVLIYPGTPFGLVAPVPSMRLKRLRRGMQDLAYLDLLQTRGRNHVGVSLAEALVRHFGVDAYGTHFADGKGEAWIEEPRIWDIARRIMADELLASLDSRSGPAAESVPLTLRWDRFMDATRKVRFKVNGVRITSAGIGPGEGLKVDCNVTIMNGRRTPLAGSLGFADLPVGWHAAPERRHVPRIEPDGARSVTLSALVASLTWDEDGVRYLPLVFEEEDGETHRFFARMCHLFPQAHEHPITLDGDLSDWPTGISNYAADFVPLWVTPEEKASRNPPDPRHKTLCLVGLAQDRLYIAIHCTAGDAPRSAVTRSSNMLPDDLVTRGDETVEILLDPAHAGTRSAADLYRIVVQGGGVRWERGVTTDPPIAPSGEWPAGIRHAIRRSSGEWTAEIEVPLDAFAEAYRHNVIWGLNFVRFDFAAQEPSNWSAATGNVYDPLSLGNVTIP